MAPLTMPRALRVLARSFAVQAAWNYERMVGTGFGWMAEPALRDLARPGDDAAYRAAVARQSRFFNAHPYFVGLAVGAAVRAEYEGESPERIARLRDALCGPLGSVGDRLFWAAWLPACAAIGITLAAVGAGLWAVAAFLVLYNVAHVYARWWAIRAGWTHGLHVAAALASPRLRAALGAGAPLAAFCLGVALPLAFAGQLRGQALVDWAGAAVGVAAVVLLIATVRRASGVALAAILLGVTWVAGFAWR